MWVTAVAVWIVLAVLLARRGVEPVGILIATILLGAPIIVALRTL